MRLRQRGIAVLFLTLAVVACATREEEMWNRFRLHNSQGAGDPELLTNTMLQHPMDFSTEPDTAQFPKIKDFENAWNGGLSKAQAMGTRLSISQEPDVEAIQAEVEELQPDHDTM